LSLTTVSFIIFIVISFSGKTFGQSSSDVTIQARTSSLKSLLASIEGIAREPPQIFKTKEGYLRFIGAPPLTHFAVSAETPEQAADAFLEKWRSLFVNESPAVGFEVHQVKSRDSRSYVRYRQKYAGLEVFGAEMIVQVNEGNRVAAVISDVMRDTVAFDTGTDVNNQGGHDMASWNPDEKNYNMFLDQFYSEENIDKIVNKLRENGLDKYAQLINRAKGKKDLEKFIDFEVLPPYADLSKLQITQQVTNIAQLKEIRQLKALLGRRSGFGCGRFRDCDWGRCCS